LRASCRVFGESLRRRGVGSNALSEPFFGQVSLLSPHISRAHTFKRYYLALREPSRSHLRGRLQAGPASSRIAAIFKMPRWSMSEASPARASIARWSICALRSLNASASKPWTRPSGWAVSVTSDSVITQGTRPPDRLKEVGPSRVFYTHEEVTKRSLRAKRKACSVGLCVRGAFRKAFDKRPGPVFAVGGLTSSTRTKTSSLRSIVVSFTRVESSRGATSVMTTNSISMASEC
jgi:hypothetical protein